MTDLFDRNRLWLVIGVVFTVLFGSIIWWNGQGRMSDLDAKISEANDNQTKYMTLIARRDALRRQYAELADNLLSTKPEIADLEASFIDTLNRIIKRHHVSIVGVNYGAVNGSNPPPPNPYVDANGKPLNTSALVAPGAQTGAAVIDLGGRAPGDPKSDRPTIPPALFTRVPVAIVIKGNWSDLVSSLQDISRQNLLMSVADPDVQRLDKSNLTLSFTTQILMPAVTIMADSGTRKKQNGSRRPGGMQTNVRTLHGAHSLPSSDRTQTRETRK